MYKPKYFAIKELVNPALLEQFAEAQLWTFFDPQLLKAADKLRDLYGVIYINYAGLTDAGARLQDSKTGAQYSAHKMFRALDLHIKSIEDKGLNKADKTKAYNDVRQELLKMKEFNCLNFEDNISWLHCDTYNRAARTFNP